jgi:hypothetical protein
MWTEVSGLRPADGVQWRWTADQFTVLLEFKGAASFSAGNGLQRADDDHEVVDEEVRSAGRGSWAVDECLQSAGEVVHALCGCGPAPTSDLTQCLPLPQSTHRQCDCGCHTRPASRPRVV